MTGFISIHEWNEHKKMGNDEAVQWFSVKIQPFNHHNHPGWTLQLPPLVLPVAVSPLDILVYLPYTTASYIHRNILTAYNNHYEITMYSLAKQAVLFQPCICNTRSEASSNHEKWITKYRANVPPIPPKPRTNCAPSCDRSVMISSVAPNSL